MGVFESTQVFPFTVTDLGPIARDVMQHFEQQGYEVKGEQTITRGWDISVSKGDTFKMILGLKTALKLGIEPSGGMTTAKAGVGIYGLQAIPTAIGLLLFWPILLPQIWGMVQQSKLDEEGLRCVETSLQKHASPVSGAATTGTTASTAGQFCTTCGAPLPGSAHFCAQCGAKAA